MGKGKGKKYLYAQMMLPEITPDSILGNGQEAGQFALEELRNIAIYNANRSQKKKSQVPHLEACFPSMPLPDTTQLTSPSTTPPFTSPPVSPTSYSPTLSTSLPPKPISPASMAPSQAVKRPRGRPRTVKAPKEKKPRGGPRKAKQEAREDQEHPQERPQVAPEVQTIQNGCEQSDHNDTDEEATTSDEWQPAYPLLLTTFPMPASPSPLKSSLTPSSSPLHSSPPTSSPPTSPPPTSSPPTSPPPTSPPPLTSPPTSPPPTSPPPPTFHPQTSPPPSSPPPSSPPPSSPQTSPPPSHPPQSSTLLSPALISQLVKRPRGRPRIVKVPKEKKPRGRPRKVNQETKKDQEHQDSPQQEVLTQKDGEQSNHNDTNEDAMRPSPSTIDELQPAFIAVGTASHSRKRPREQSPGCGKNTSSAPSIFNQKRKGKKFWEFLRRDQQPSEV